MTTKALAALLGATAILALPVLTPDLAAAGPRLRAERSRR